MGVLIVLFLGGTRGRLDGVGELHVRRCIDHKKVAPFVGYWDEGVRCHVFRPIILG